MHRPYPKATRQAAIRGRRLDRDREEEKESRVGIRTDFAGQFSTRVQGSRTAVVIYGEVCRTSRWYTCDGFILSRTKALHHSLSLIRMIPHDLLLIHEATDLKQV